MLLALDIGTTHTKALLLNRAGNALQRQERRNMLLDNPSGMMEQSPEAIWQQVYQLIENLHVSKPEKLVLSTAMHGFIAADSQNMPLTNCWLWSDLRADALAQHFRHTETGKDWYFRTGVPVHAMSPALKWKWAKENRQDWISKVARIFDIKSWIWYQLTGEFAIDYACAAATGLMHAEQGKWDEKILEALGIAPDYLPEIVRPGHCAALRPELARQWGKITCMIGTSDGAAAACALPEEAQPQQYLSATIGTSAALRMLSEKPVLDEAMRTFCYRVDEKRFIVGGASNNGANVLEWMQKNMFGGRNTLVELLALAGLSEPGAGGLIFAPYIYGERAPLYRGDVTGGFVGLQSKHTQADMVRAVMEGILLNLRLIAEGVRAQLPFERILLGGGFSQNRLGVQMLADILQTPVQCVQEGMDQSIAGLLRLTGNFFEIEMSSHFYGPQFEPDITLKDIYENVYRHFTEVVKGL